MQRLGSCHWTARGHSRPQQRWKDQTSLETGRVVVEFPACGGQECPRSVKYGVSVGLAILLTSLLSGCIVIPFSNRETGNARKDLGQATANQIDPGTATIEDVILELGEPDAVSPDERTIAYRSQRSVAAWIIAGGYSTGGGTIDEVRFLVIEFDEHGIVRRCQATNQMTSLFSPPIRDTPQAVIATPISSIGDEPVRLSGIGDWFPDYELTAWKIPPTQRSGRVLLTDSRICYLSHDQLGNSAPLFSMDYQSIAECKLCTSFSVKWIILRTKEGKAHSLMVWKTSWTDNELTKRIVSFIQSKIQASGPPQANPDS